MTQQKRLFELILLAIGVVGLFLIWWVVTRPS